MVIREITVKADQLIPMDDMRISHDAVDDDELLKSIQQHGIKDALTCRYTEDQDLYEIIDGRRRFTIGQIAGFTEFRITVEEMTDLEAYSIAFTKNYHRKSMEESEEALWLYKMTDKFELTQQKLANLVGVGRTTITKRLKLADWYRKASPAERKVVKNVRQLYALEQMGEAKKKELIGAAMKNGGELASGRELMRKASAIKEVKEVLDKWKHHDDEFVVYMLQEEAGVTAGGAADIIYKFRRRKMPWQVKKIPTGVTRVPDGDPKAQMYAKLSEWYPLEIIDAIDLVAPAKTIGTWQNNARSFIRELYRRTPANTKTMLQEIFL